MKQFESRTTFTDGVPHIELYAALAGLEKGVPRPGRKPKFGTHLIQRVVEMTTRHKPPPPLAPFSVRPLTGPARPLRPTPPFACSPILFSSWFTNCAKTLGHAYARNAVMTRTLPMLCAFQPMFTGVCVMSETAIGIAMGLAVSLPPLAVEGVGSFGGKLSPPLLLGVP